MKVYGVDVLGENSNSDIRFYVDSYESLSMTEFDEEIELTAVIGEKYYSVKNEGGNTVTVTFFLYMKKLPRGIISRAPSIATGTIITLPFCAAFRLPALNSPNIPSTLRVPSG